MKYVVNQPAAEAIQFDGSNVQDCMDFAALYFSGFPGEEASYNDQAQVIITARGYTVNLSDWMVAPPYWGNLQTAGVAEIVPDAVFQVKYSAAPEQA